MATTISNNKTLADVEAVTSSKAAASGIASLNGSSLVVQNPASASASPGAAAIPIANGSGKLVAGWGGAASTLATLNGSSLVVENPASKGQASGLAELNGSSLVVQNPASKGQASGLAELNGSSLVVQNPASATATPTSASIPIADGSGDLDVGWVPNRVGRWVKFTKTFSDFAAAALTNDIEILSLPALGTIKNVVIRHTTAFTGGGIAAYTISVGIVGNFTKYSAAFNVFQATGNTVFSYNSLQGMENFGAVTSIRAEATADANLDTAAAGSVDIYILTSTLP